MKRNEVLEAGPIEVLEIGAGPSGGAIRPAVTAEIVIGSKRSRTWWQPTPFPWVAFCFFLGWQAILVGLLALGPTRWVFLTAAVLGNLCSVLLMISEHLSLRARA